MRPGHLEVMVNRRTASTDGLGNPEALNEQEGGHGVLMKGTVSTTTRCDLFLHFYILRLDTCCGCGSWTPRMSVAAPEPGARSPT